MTNRTLVLISLIGALTLAGCADSRGGRSGAVDVEYGEVSLHASDTTGIMLGVVVDDAVRPIDGATVALRGTELSATTDREGRFGFGDVEPGTHVLHVSHDKYYPQEVIVPVRAGEDNPPVVRVQLQSNPEVAPYHQVIYTEIYFQCGVSLMPDYGFSACQAPNGASDILCVTAGVCLGPLTAHNGLAEVDPGVGPIHFAQAEAVWRPTNAFGEQLDFLIGARDPDTIEWHNSSHHIGQSPVTMPWEHERLLNARIGQGNVFALQVYPYGTSVVIEQDIEFFVTTFFNYSPPSGWTLVNDGEPTTPP